MRTSRSFMLKVAAWSALVAAVAAVVLQNRDPVQTQFLLITVEMPQIMLLALTTAAGFVLGLVTPALWRSRREGARAWPRPGAASPWPDEAAPDASGAGGTAGASGPAGAGAAGASPPGSARHQRHDQHPA